MPSPSHITNMSTTPAPYFSPTFRRAVHSQHPLARRTKRVPAPWAFAALLMAVLSLLSPAAMAETFKKITTDQLERLMKAEGYSTKRDKDGDIVWTSEGMRWAVMVSPKGTSITARFTVTDKTTIERINEWNRTKSFSKSFLDKDGDPSLELDVELNGGIERERLQDFFRTAVASRSLWIKEVFKD